MKVIDSGVILDREQLRDITLNDAGLMAEIMSALVEHTSQQIHRLAEAVRDHDQSGCLRMAHSCKGACANVGANRAAALFLEIERNASAGTFEMCGDTLGTLRGEIELLRAEAQSLIAAI